MENLAAFVMIGLLYLASNLAEVESVKYTGDTLVRDGQPWNITCTEVPKGSTIMWKRNGQPLVEDLASGIMHVEPAKIEDGYITSTLIATTALERHEGSYVCSEGNETHHLAIIYDVTLMVLMKDDKSVVLECPEHGSGEKIEWIKDKKPLVETEFKRQGSKNGTLIITYNTESKENKEIYGNYTCKVGNVSADYRVVRKPAIILPSSHNVVEGEKLHLTCAVKIGDPGLKILWNFKGKNYSSSEGRVKLSRDEEKNLNNAVFTLDNVQMDDRGNISCLGYYNIGDTNELHYDIASTFLRVKDKFAAFWPFLGIVAEVIILCLIIIIYEKKRNKSELEESDTDQSPDTKPTPNKDSDVRQRK